MGERLYIGGFSFHCSSFFIHDMDENLVPIFNHRHVHCFLFKFEMLLGFSVFS